MLLSSQQCSFSPLESNCLEYGTFLLYLPEKMEIVSTLSHFNTHKKCIFYLERQRWKGTPICPYCNSTKSSAKKNELRHKCHNCGRSFSVLVGTIFESSKLPLPKWFAAICLILNAKKGISSLQLARDIGVNKNTGWYLQKRIRQAMQENDFYLKGIVEIDETYVGGNLGNKHYITRVKSGKYHKTGMQHKVPVLGMMEKGGRVHLKVLDKAWGKEIQPLIKKFIDAKSTIVTDGFGGYYGLRNHFENHIILNHAKEQRTIGNYSLSALEGFWTIIKRAIMGQYHKISQEHLQDYLNELSFKYNNRHKDIFKLLINNLLTPNYAFS